MYFSVFFRSAWLILALLHLFLPCNQYTSDPRETYTHFFLSPSRPPGLYELRVGRPPTDSVCMAPATGKTGSSWFGVPVRSRSTHYPCLRPIDKGGADHCRNMGSGGYVAVLVRVVQFCRQCPRRCFLFDGPALGGPLPGRAVFFNLNSRTKTAIQHFPGAKYAPANWPNCATS